MASVWHVAQREELSAQGEELDAVEHNGRRHTVMKTPTSLWLVSEWGSGARVACRLAFSPGELTVGALHRSDGGGLEVQLSSSIGDQVATVAFDDDGTISAVTTLHAESDLTFEGW